jgi:hypothetical protein
MPVCTPEELAAHECQPPVVLPLALPTQDGLWLEAEWTFWPNQAARPLICLFSLPYPASDRIRAEREARIHEAMMVKTQAHWPQAASILRVFPIGNTALARDPDLAFHIPLLAKRILDVVRWVKHQPLLAESPRWGGAFGTVSAGLVRALHAQPDAFDALLAEATHVDMAGKVPLQALKTPLDLLVSETSPAIQARLDKVTCLLSPQCHRIETHLPPGE